MRLDKFISRGNILIGNVILVALVSFYNANMVLNSYSYDSPKISSIASKQLNKPLNIIILYPDDWRYDDIGGTAPVVRTPFLNQLAKMGIHFTYNAVTTSICWISRATMFTGQYASRHGSIYLFRPWFVKYLWNETWVYQLQKHKEYFVGHIGKWQFQNTDPSLDDIFNFTSIHEGMHWYKIKSESSETKISAADRAQNDTFEFLNKRPKDKPFALTVAFYPPKAVGNVDSPGGQWSPTEETRHLYDNDTIPIPKNHHNDSIPYFIKNYRDNIAMERYQMRWRSSKHYQEGMKNYYALITHVDVVCEQIVNRLIQEQLINQTMIIFTTDNGLMHGAHGLAGKWYPYQESIRVPLIIYDPRMPHDKRGTIDQSLTLNIDLATTILGAANINPPERMQGRDISNLYLPSISSEQKSWRTDFYYEYPIGEGLPRDTSVTALVEKDWKYIYWPETKYQQLFDLQNDPFEMHDLATNPTRQIRHRMKKMKKRHDELKLKVMEPIIPGSKCDPLQRAGVKVTDLKPNCYPKTIKQKIYHHILLFLIKLIDVKCSAWFGLRFICHLLFPLINQFLSNEINMN